MTFRSGLMGKIGECRALTKARNRRRQAEQLAAAIERRGVKPTKVARSEAGEAAVTRLIEAHRDEFDGYFAEELAARHTDARET